METTTTFVCSPAFPLGVGLAMRTPASQEESWGIINIEAEA